MNWVTLKAIVTEMLGAARICADLRSLLQFWADIFNYRLLRLRSFRNANARRTIRLKTGERLTYRLNRGDILTVKEVFLNRCYRLPFSLPGAGGVLVDFGANIGLASIFLTRTYGFNAVVGVEPLPENAELARLNYAQNNLRGEVIQAAVGPVAGSTQFSIATDHNQGQIASEGELHVDVVTAQSVFDRAGSDRVRLVKLDIEGGEDALLRREPGWLQRVEAIIGEIHTDRVDHMALIDIIKRAGFRYYAPFEGDNTENAFIRTA